MKWLLLLLLAGCAAPPAVEVKVPVHVPCIDAAKVPVRPVNKFGQGEYPGDAEAVKLALLDALAWESYALEVEVQLAGCSADATTLPKAAP